MNAAATGGRKKVTLVRPGRSPREKTGGLGQGELGCVSTPLLKGGTHPTLSSGTEKIKKIDEEDPAYSELVAAVLSLPAAQKKTLAARLSLDLLDKGRPDQREIEMWAEGVRRGLAALGTSSEGAGSVAVLVRLLGSPSHWRPVADFVASSGLARLSVTERMAAYSVLGDLLAVHSRRLAAAVGAPLTPTFVAGQAHHVAAVFDAAFPGYAAAGLAAVVVGRS